MPESNLHHLTSEEVDQTIAITRPSQLKNIANQLSLEGIQQAFRCLSLGRDPKKIEKSFAILEPLNDHGQLEAAGAGLSASLFLSLITENARKRKSPLSTKIDALLVGISQEVFQEILTRGTEEHLSLLKQESVAEPMHHHLLLFAHEIEKKNQQINQAFFQLHREIEEAELEEMAVEDLEEIKAKIHSLALYYQKTIESLNKALAIAWNTNRPDLIDQLTTLKESAIRQKLLGVGENVDRAYAPYSLHAILKAHLDSIFGDSENPDDIEALHDDDAAIEGLVKFSLWYLTDYVDIGLLSPLPAEEHELNQEEREEYFHQAQESLEKAGLATVRDLKQQRIFSAKMLQQYLMAHSIKR